MAYCRFILIVIETRLLETKKQCIILLNSFYYNVHVRGHAPFVTIK
jgi:hypothetical protein